MRVLIVDDESLARQRVRRLLQREADVEVVGEADTGRTAVTLIQELKPDLVCLDVQMPELDGFGVLNELGTEFTPMVMFVTAYDEHAQRAFDVHAIDYVLKPVDADRFRAAFERARTQRANAAAAQRLEQLLDTVRRIAVDSPSGSSATNSNGSSTTWPLEKKGLPVPPTVVPLRRTRAPVGRTRSRPGDLHRRPLQPQLGTPAESS